MSWGLQHVYVVINTRCARRCDKTHRARIGDRTWPASYVISSAISKATKFGVTGTRGGVSGSPLTTGGGAIDVYKVVERTGRWSWPLRGELLREERALR